MKGTGNAFLKYPALFDLNQYQLSMLFDCWAFFKPDYQWISNPGESRCNETTQVYFN